MYWLILSIIPLISSKCIIPIATTIATTTLTTTTIPTTTIPTTTIPTTTLTTIATTIVTNPICNPTNFIGCEEIAATDFQTSAEAAAFVAGESFDQACLDLNNHVRSLYANNGQYIYDPVLASWATVSATYAGTLNVWNAHSYYGLWGQNLYVSKTSCADAYTGWITQEALGLGYQGQTGHFFNAAALIYPYVSVGCGTAAGAIVCNFGVNYPIDTSSMPNINDAMTAALAGKLI